jgi:hypothetical protein
MKQIFKSLLEFYYVSVNYIILLLKNIFVRILRFMLQSHDSQSLSPPSPPM